jgi:hypothetical protein
MVTVSKIDPSSTNRCQACPNLGTKVVTFAKKRLATGSFNKPVISVLVLCDGCCGELCEALPKRKPELVEQQFQEDYK